MDQRHLRAFVSVADLGGISAAAERLGYAQSTLSVQLQRLERDLGASLFNRSNAGAALTEEGQRLLPYAREALNLEDEMRRVVRSGRPRLRIGALETLAGEWLPDILAALAQGAAGPEGAAEVSMVVARRAQLEDDLAAGRLDLVFVFDNGVPTIGPHAVVGHDRTVLVAGPGHPLAKVPRISQGMLLEAEFLIAEPGCTSQMLVDRFGQDLTSRTCVSMVTGSLAALRRLACHGRGVALMPHLSVVGDLEDGELVELDVREGLAPVSIEARWRTGLGPAEAPMQAVLRLARRHQPPSRPLAETA
ncbi:LysR family transcriptional regulator [Streptomyces sp. NBC_00669]|uniref:LysR family transcriptional regulator n=1 Tax=unclassified Streptomyces TaxID=2593676 RepID=UPI002E37E8C6|nr:LysR family transcriptional regulator [Streptomyces sp. NBC_00669]